MTTKKKAPEAKKKLGRPTKYNENIQKKADNYLSKCGDYDELPSLEGLAEVMGINTDTVQEWKKDNPIFSVSVKKIKELQRKRLMEKGLDNTWNSPMAMFLLKCNHGFIDRQVVHNVDTPENQVEKLLNKMGE